MTDSEGPWAAVSSVYKKDLDLVTEAALRGDDSPTPSGSVREAADRLGLIIEALTQLDTTTSSKPAGVIDSILFYIGYRVGKLTDRLPFRPRISEIQLPSRHVLALIQGDKTLDQILAEVDEEL